MAVGNNGGREAGIGQIKNNGGSAPRGRGGGEDSHVFSLKTRQVRGLNKTNRLTAPEAEVAMAAIIVVVSERIGGDRIAITP